MPVCLIGDTSVGKTSLIKNLQNLEFDEYSESTVGASFVSLKLNDKILNKYDNKNLSSLEIWDTAGQERYRSLVPLYFRNAKLVILVLDFKNDYMESFNFWINHINEKKKLNVIVVFSKSDLYTPPPKIINNIKTRLFKYQKNADVVLFSSKTNNGKNILIDTILKYLDYYYKNIAPDKLMIEKISIENKPRYNCCYII